MSDLFYPPLSAPFLALLAGVAALVVLFIQIGILRYVYERIGLDAWTAFFILVASLVGAYVNLPVAWFPGKVVVSNQIVSYFGMQYVVPLVHGSPGTILALNVGGAIIPTMVSIYLLGRHAVWLKGLAAIAFVALVTHQLAHPIRGLGIALPIFAPAAAGALAAMLLSIERAAPLAYIGGSTGTLIGADLLNLDKLANLGAPVASVGGAGTFDGIFLAGILAVLVASLPSALVGPHR